MICQNHEEDFFNFCVLLRKSELYMPFSQGYVLTSKLDVSKVFTIYPNLQKTMLSVVYDCQTSRRQILSKDEFEIELQIQFTLAFEKEFRKELLLPTTVIDFHRSCFEVRSYDAKKLDF